MIRTSDPLDQLGGQLPPPRGCLAGAARPDLPEPKPYVWNAEGERRAAEVAAELAGIRAKIAATRRAEEAIP